MTTTGKIGDRGSFNAGNVKGVATDAPKLMSDKSDVGAVLQAGEANIKSAVKPTGDVTTGHVITKGEVKSRPKTNLSVGATGLSGEKVEGTAITGRIETEVPVGNSAVKLGGTITRNFVELVGKNNKKSDQSNTVYGVNGSVSSPVGKVGPFSVKGEVNGSADLRFNDNDPKGKGPFGSNSALAFVGGGVSAMIGDKKGPNFTVGTGAKIGAITTKNGADWQPQARVNALAEGKIPITSNGALTAGVKGEYQRNIPLNGEKPIDVARVSGNLDFQLNKNEKLGLTGGVVLGGNDSTNLNSRSAEGSFVELKYDVRL